MKNFIGLLFIIIVVEACEKAETDENMDAPMSLKSAYKPLPDDSLILNQHFELNIIGKKDNWNNKSFNNPNRHTIFVPRNTEGWAIEPSNPNTDTEPGIPGIEIVLTQGDNFEVVDGSVFDGDKAELQLGEGKYEFFISLRGKNNTRQIVDSLISLNETWTQSQDTLFPPWPFDNLTLGEVEVVRSWTNITDLFTINAEEADPLPFDPALGEEQWIFDYLDWLSEIPVNLGDIDGDGIDDIGLYVNLVSSWQLQNRGSQLIKVRFYALE